MLISDPAISLSLTALWLHSRVHTRAKVYLLDASDCEYCDVSRDMHDRQPQKQRGVSKASVQHT